MEKEMNSKEAESLQADLIHQSNKTNSPISIEINGTIAYTQQVPWI